MALPTIEVLVPTRGRPTRAMHMADSWDRTRESAFTGLTLVLDENDKSYAEYRNLSAGRPWVASAFGTGTMVERTNLAARELRADIFGWAADDNFFVTPGWDTKVRKAFERPGITTVNTNDLLVGDEKGGVYFVRKQAIRKLGWFLPPFLEHLYVDYAITEMAKKAGTYKYLDDVVIEHLHPYSGKAQWDDLYRSVNNSGQDDRDRAAYYEWWNSERGANDTEVLRTCLG